MDTVFRKFSVATCSVALLRKFREHTLKGDRSMQLNEGLQERGVLLLRGSFARTRGSFCFKFVHSDEKTDWTKPSKLKNRTGS